MLRAFSETSCDKSLRVHASQVEKFIRLSRSLVSIFGISSEHSFCLESCAVKMECTDEETYTLINSSYGTQKIQITGIVFVTLFGIKLIDFQRTLNLLDMMPNIFSIIRRVLFNLIIETPVQYWLFPKRIWFQNIRFHNESVVN